MEEVRNHNIGGFRRAQKRIKEAIRGSARLVPQSGLCMVMERDYGAIQGTILARLRSSDGSRISVELLNLQSTAPKRIARTALHLILPGGALRRLTKRPCNCSFQTNLVRVTAVCAI